MTLPVLVASIDERREEHRAGRHLQTRCAFIALSLTRQRRRADGRKFPKIEVGRSHLESMVGLPKISVGDKGACEFCYAEPLARIARRAVEGAPRKGWAGSWRCRIGNKRAPRSNGRPFVFCANMTDIFDNRSRPNGAPNLSDHAQVTTAWCGCC